MVAGEQSRYEECKKQIHDTVRQRIDLSREVTDAEIQDMIDDLIVGLGRKYALSLNERQELGKSVFYAIRKMDVLQELIDCDEVTEIMINGTENIFIEKSGHIYEWDKHFDTREKLENVIQQIVAKCNRVVNEASPIVDARLENGSRVNIVLAPVALNGPIVTIRRFPNHPISMEDLLRFGSITKQASDELEKLVIAGYNIFISGGTGYWKNHFFKCIVPLYSQGRAHHYHRRFRRTAASGNPQSGALRDKECKHRWSKDDYNSGFDQISPSYAAQCHQNKRERKRL